MNHVAMGQVENTEIQKPKWGNGNGSMKVRKTDSRMYLVGKGWLSLSDVSLALTHWTPANMNTVFWHDMVSAVLSWSHSQITSVYASVFSWIVELPQPFAKILGEEL